MPQFARHQQRVLLIACVILAVASLVLWRELNRISTGHLEVHFLDVGQGDSALLVSPSGRTVLIDGGPDLSALERLGEVLPLSDRTIDMLILSHPDPDHFAAFGEILRRYEVGALLLPPIENTEERYLALLAIARERSVPLVTADPARDMVFGDGLTLDVLWPPDPPPIREDNDASIVLRVAFGTGSVLFTGDISESAEAKMLLDGIDVSAQVLKIGHHGSRFSSSVAFLAAVSPRLAVISVGKDNHYGHPSLETLERLMADGIPVRETENEGTIDLVF